MKKIIIIFLSTFILLIGKVEANVSDSFSKVLSIMNIPKTNKDGYFINEDMYNKYNLIVYGNPQDVSKNQRWKDLDSRQMDKRNYRKSWGVQNIRIQPYGNYRK